MPIIEQLSAREILDSRGRPTVSATCVLRGGVSASASIPSGVSTGKAEAHELRDGDSKRYRGLGCRQAAGHVNGEIDRLVRNRGFASQAELDTALVVLDGTPDKSRLGANALLAVSIAFARAMALERGVPLYQQFAEIRRERGLKLNQHAGVAAVEAAKTLPRLTINLFSGGKHAGQQVAIQDVLIIPLQAGSIDQTLVTAYDIYQAASDILLRRFGMRLLRADEGGLAPPCHSAEEMLDLALDSIRQAGYTPGIDVFLGLDVASSHFYTNGRYHLGAEELDSLGMVERVRQWVERYPVISVEDGLSEDDWEHWPRLLGAIGTKAVVLGDDLLCTNSERIRRAVEVRACDALLLKVNQAGTLTEAADAYWLARSAGWSITVSVRSGETEDNWAADLAVGWGADQFKNGSITQSERLSKYNRLLTIEEETRWPVCPWPKRVSRS
jgi:enolase